MVRQVWNQNLRRELAILEQALPSYPVFTVDCEFPGFLLTTPRNATDDFRYNDLRRNVDQTHLIQLGITLSNHRGTVFQTWEFNFEFDLDKEVHTKETIKFLSGHGIDFEKHRLDGIKRARFATQFSSLLARRTASLKWVTFHGLYDFAYILKVITNTPMPHSLSSFRDSLGYAFEEIIDLKVMAKSCHGICDMEIGLQRLADLLNIKREGEAHQAGSDSLLTALAYSEMRRRFQIHQGAYTDYLYGITERIGRTPPAFQVQYSQPMCQPLPLLVPCYHRYPPPPPPQCFLLPVCTPVRMGQY